MIEKACPDNAEEILLIINTSNREAYKNIIPKEHFKEPVLSLEKLLEDFGRMTFYVYESEGRIVGVALYKLKVRKLEGFIGSTYFRNIKGGESEPP